MDMSNIVYMSDFKHMLKHVKSNTIDLVVADWPFRRGIIDDTSLKMYKDGTEEAARILTLRGNFVSIHYLRNNLKVANEAHQNGLTLTDHPVIPMVCKAKYEGMLGKAFMSIFVFSKSDDRIFNDTSKRKKGRYYRKEDALSDVWMEKEFRNGYINKEYNEKVSEAMPRSVVRKLMNLYTIDTSKVVDFFGGSGNFSVECAKRNLECITAELNPDHYRIINRRLSEFSSDLIKAASNSNYTIKGGLRGKEKEQRKRLRTYQL